MIEFVREMKNNHGWFWFFVLTGIATIGLVTVLQAAVKIVQWTWGME